MPVGQWFFLCYRAKSLLTPGKCEQPCGERGFIQWGAVCRDGETSGLRSGFQTPDCYAAFGSAGYGDRVPVHFSDCCRRQVAGCRLGEGLADLLTGLEIEEHHRITARGSGVLPVVLKARRPGLLLA